jgi:hypothetical protein
MSYPEQAAQPKTFIDKIADALLGGDEQSPASKYALICQKCFAHNGLVLKDEVMDVRESLASLFGLSRSSPWTINVLTIGSYVNVMVMVMACRVCLPSLWSL